MATTFTLSSQKYQARYMELSCVQIQDIANNKSTINWTLTVKDPNNSYGYSTGPTTVKINGVTVYSKGRVSYTKKIFPAVKGSVSGTLEVEHDSNGAKSVVCSISTAIYDTAVQTNSDTWTLDSIPRSGVSCSTANIGTVPTITIAKAASGFTHTLKYEFYSLSGTIVEKTSASTYTDWVLPDSFYWEIPNSPSGTGKIICETYNGDTLLGTTECSFTANVNRATSDPMVSPTIKDTNEKTIALTGDDSVLVKHYSNASVTTGATARNGATIVSQTTTNGSSTLLGSTCTFEGVESGAFSFAVEDSRGYVAEPVVDLTAAGKFIEYIKPTCSINVGRMDGNGNITVVCKGNCFRGSFGAVDNELQVQYRYKTQNGMYGAPEDMDITYTGNSYTAIANVTGLNYQEDYVFEVVATDKLGAAPISSSVDKSIPVFHWGKDNFQFYVPVYDKDGKRLPSVDEIYPVGSVVIRYDHISPASLYGGTWTRVYNTDTGVGVFLYGCTEADVIGEFGGEAAVTLTVDQMPSHSHGLKRITSALASSSSGWARFSADGTADNTVITNTGGGAAHNNMPPFVNVSIWRRTA